ncbi:hypothetical protein MMC31_005542 [Peltigera leucophlebia]|nr:hypothetical protein [Peltigera leucophlebia]
MDMRPSPPLPGDSSPPLPGDSSPLDNMTHELTPKKMPQSSISDNIVCESNCGDDDFAIESDSESSDSWSPKVNCFMKKDHKRVTKANNNTGAGQVIFYRLPTSSFQTPPSPTYSMLTRGLRRCHLDIFQAGMKSAEHYKKREWDLRGWLELRHCQQYELSLIVNKHMTGPAEADASKSFEHGGDEEKRRYGW